MRLKDCVSKQEPGECILTPQASGPGIKLNLTYVYLESKGANGEKRLLLRHNPTCNSFFRVLKTIRLNATELLHNKHDFDTYKVIILIRDPRAVFNSMLKRPQTWDVKRSTYIQICTKLAAYGSFIHSGQCLNLEHNKDNGL